MLAVVQWRTTNVLITSVITRWNQVLRLWKMLAFRVTIAMRFLFLQNLGILSLPQNDEMNLHFYFLLFKPSLGMPQNGGSANIAGKGRDSLRLWRCGSAWRPWWCMLFSMLAFAGKFWYELMYNLINIPTYCILYIISCYVCLKRSSCLQWADALYSIRFLYMHLFWMTRIHYDHEFLPQQTAPTMAWC